MAFKNLYWKLGKQIHFRIEENGWGRGTVTERANILSRHTPGLRGFSASNLWRLRQFYETWRDTPENLATPLRDLATESKNHFKDRYVLDFLDLPARYSEQDLSEFLELQTRTNT